MRERIRPFPYQRSPFQAMIRDTNKIRPSNLRIDAAPRHLRGRKNGTERLQQKVCLRTIAALFVFSLMVFYCFSLQPRGCESVLELPDTDTHTNRK